MEKSETVKLEVKDIAVYGILSILAGTVTYFQIKALRNSSRSDLTDRQKRRQQGLVKRELWEHSANQSALGITMFLLLVFNAVTDSSDFPLWLRLVISLACVFAVLFVLRVTMRAVFKFFFKKSEI